MSEIAADYDRLGGPLERLAREAGRPLRYPDNPLSVKEVQRMAGASLHAPIPASVATARISRLDDPDDEIREVARARFVAEHERSDAA